MKNKGLFLGYLGDEFNESLKIKLEKSVKISIEKFSMQYFYFGNDKAADDDTDSDYPLIKQYKSEQKKINEFLLTTIQKYKKEHDRKDIKSVLMVARPTDKNYRADLYDEIIQGYPIYYGLMENTEDVDAFTERDNYLNNHVDTIFWYSNPLLTHTVNTHKIIFLDELENAMDETIHEE